MPGPQVGTDQTHVLTVWGDDGDPNELTTNPLQLKVADSDRDDPNNPDGPNIQTYTYDDFADPIHEIEEGYGWYFDWSEPTHPYIVYAAVLSNAGTPVHCQGNVKMLGSYEIAQNEPDDAIGLHYDVGTDTQICRYTTTIDRSAPAPAIVEDQQPPWNLTVDWDLAANPVTQGTRVKITTAFFLNVRNAIEYSNVSFTYGGEEDRPDLRGRDVKPAFFWSIETPGPVDAGVYPPGMASGFVVGAFELYDDPNGANLVGRYRFEHQYSPGYDPEYHDFRLESRDGSSFCVGNLRFGHKWVYVDADALWDLGPADWMPVTPPSPDLIYIDPVTPYDVTIDWSDQLPYPQLICPGGSPQCAGDCNCDGLVNFADINDFVDAIVGDVYCDQTGLNADVSGNGHVGFEDINPFVSLLTTNPLPLYCP